MFRFNAKAWTAAIVAPVTLIVMRALTDGAGLDTVALPWVQPAVEYGVATVLTGWSTWRVPNAT